MSVWDELAVNPYVQVAQNAIATFFSSDPPQFLYLPWSLHDRAALRELVMSAGFEEPSIEVVPHTVELPTAYHAARGLVQGNPTILDVEERANGTVEEVVEVVAFCLGQAFGHEPFRAPMRALVIDAERAP